jgi:hypothetical protein
MGAGGAAKKEKLPPGEPSGSLQNIEATEA